MRSRVALPVALAALLAATAARADDPLAGDALDRYVDSVIEAYGGADAVARLAAFRAEGEVTAHIRGGTATVRRDLKAPDSLRVELVYPDRTEIRVLAGRRGWRGDAGGLEEVAGLPRTAMVHQLLRAAAPYFVDRHRDRLVHHTTVSDDAGRRYRALRLRWSPSLTVDFWVDDQTRLIAIVQGSLSAGPVTLAFATQYQDFEAIDGLQVARTEHSIVGHRHTGTAKIQRTTFGAAELGPFFPGDAAPGPGLTPDKKP